MFPVTDLSSPMQSKVIVLDSGCWQWQGAIQSSGYGSVSNGNGGSMLAHRRAYEELVAEIKPGLTIDHLCLNKLCMNPAHMEQVTVGENSRRKNERQTHCKHGHELSGGNLRLRERADGYKYRACVKCAVRHTRVYRTKKRVEAQIARAA